MGRYGSNEAFCWVPWANKFAHGTRRLQRGEEQAILCRWRLVFRALVVLGEGPIAMSDALGDLVMFDVESDEIHHQRHPDGELMEQVQLGLPPHDRRPRPHSQNQGHYSRTQTSGYTRLEPGDFLPWRSIQMPQLDGLTGQLLEDHQKHQGRHMGQTGHHAAKNSQPDVHIHERGAVHAEPQDDGADQHQRVGENHGCKGPTPGPVTRHQDIEAVLLQLQRTQRSECLRQASHVGPDLLDGRGESPEGTLWISTLRRIIGNLPVYMALTAKYSAQEHKNIAIKTCFAVFCFLTVSFLAGKYAILFFGIQMSAFKLVGGILLLYVAFTMITNNKTSYLFSGEEMDHKNGISLMPLTFPLLVGPAAISSVIIQSNVFTTWFAKAISILEFVLIGFLIWLTLTLAQKIMQILGKTGIRFLTQIMGLLLGSLAIGFIADELKTLFPGLS